MLPQRHRLTDGRDFTRTLRPPSSDGGRAVRVGSSTVVVHALAPRDPSDAPVRVGLIVSKAVGIAVVRNRTKRRLRALLAEQLPGLPGGTDLVLRANPAAAQASTAALAKDLNRSLAKVRHRLAASEPAGGRA